MAGEKEKEGYGSVVCNPICDASEIKKSSAVITM
jgi:hypothetical protein